MSNSPMPAAHTAAMLAMRRPSNGHSDDTAAIALLAAQVASDVHRLRGVPAPVRVLRINERLAQFGCALIVRDPLALEIVATCGCAPMQRWRL